MISERRIIIYELLGGENIGFVRPYMQAIAKGKGGSIGEIAVTKTETGHRYEADFVPA